MRPPASSTKTFGMIRHRDAKQAYEKLSRIEKPQTRTIANQLRPSGTETTTVHVFRVEWQSLDTTEILIPTSMGSGPDVYPIAHRYAETLTVVPRGLRREVKRIHVVPGDHNPTGGHGNINMYTAADPDRDRLANIFTHEAAHTYNQKMRDDRAKLNGWEAAVAADRRAGGPLRGFISEYAAENPEKEDFGESLAAWLAQRYYPERLNAIDPRYVPFIRSQIAHRIDFFLRMGLDQSPLSL